jgi:hypothetical protein
MGSPTARIFAGLFLLLAASAGAFYLLMPVLIQRYIAQQVVEDEDFVSNLKTTVVRTDKGDTVHLKITVLVPPGTKAEPTYQKIMLYGLLGEGDARKDRNGDCHDPAKCKSGYPMLIGPFVPGTTQVIEVDLPRSFVEAKDAHFHLGLGSDLSYYPSNDLLHPPAPAPPKP